MAKKKDPDKSWKERFAGLHPGWHLFMLWLIGAAINAGCDQLSDNSGGSGVYRPYADYGDERDPGF